MKHKCSVCGHEYELGEHTLPGCPECIRSKMKHPDGLSSDHTYSTARPNASYIADGVNPRAIYEYMAGGSHTEVSGCVIYYAKQYNSLNAVSYKPLADIPGSGSFGSGPISSEFAVWVDLEGKSSQGPHLNFEEESHLHQRVANGDWVPAPKCASCGIVYVWKTGEVCLNCQSTAGGATP